MLKILSLFSGIGGFEVGLSLSNLANHAEVTQFVEFNLFCQHVLATRFPGIPIFSDVKQFNSTPGEFDIVVGGVPCQSFSSAGARKGHYDSRNLFPEYFRIIRETQPKYAVIENVQGLLSVNHGQMFKGILWAFYQLGYSVQWQIISVANLGGVHRRNRVFILAERKSENVTNTDSIRRNSRRCDWEGRHIQTDQERKFTKIHSERGERELGIIKICSDDVTDTQSERRIAFRLLETQTGETETPQYSCARTSTEIRRRLAPSFVEAMLGYPLHWTDTTVATSDLLDPKLLTHSQLEAALPYATDYEIMPCRKERLCALGNSVSPQCAKIVWQRIYNKFQYA